MSIDILRSDSGSQRPLGVGSSLKVIGLTGTIGAGKDAVKKILTTRFNSYQITLSSILHAELKKEKSTLDRKGLQNLGNELRRKYGAEILAKLATEYLPRDKELTIVDGIRNPAEADYLRKKFGENFIWIGVDAPPEVRFKRLVKRAEGKDPKTWEEFVVMEERDKGTGEPEYGQQTGKCMERVDFKIINDGTLKDLGKKVKEIVDEFSK